MKSIIRKSLLLVLPLLAALLFEACNACSRQKDEGTQLTDFEKALSVEDSLAVVDLVNHFYALVEDGDYTSAAAMLYQADNEEAYGEPRLLNNEEMAEVKQMFQLLPIYDHRIDYVKFSQSYSNEVKTTAVIRPKSAELPEATTCFYFKPVNYLGQWVLTAVSSNQGDRTIVKSTEKDSLQDLYKEEEKSLNEAAANR